MDGLIDWLILLSIELAVLSSAWHIEFKKKGRTSEDLSSNAIKAKEFSSGAGSQQNHAIYSRQRSNYWECGCMWPINTKQHLAFGLLWKKRWDGHDIAWFYWKMVVFPAKHSSQFRIMLASTLKHVKLVGGYREEVIGWKFPRDLRYRSRMICKLFWIIPIEDIGWFSQTIVTWNAR